MVQHRTGVEGCWGCILSILLFIITYLLDMARLETAFRNLHTNFTGFTDSMAGSPVHRNVANIIMTLHQYDDIMSWP